MLLGTRKRGQAGGGDGNYDDRGAALLGALGLGSFARLDLPAPPDGIDLAAALDLASGRITVSLGGDRVTASAADLAAALALPLGPVALAAEVDAAVFSSAEAIITVRGFVHDRLLLGAGGDGGALPEEVVAALRLVDEGKAYAVDWGRLVWAVLKREMLTGKTRRVTPLLLRLIKRQRPELFSEVDGRLLLGKRKGLTLQKRQRTDEQLVDCSKVEVEEESSLHGNSGSDQRLAAEAEVGGLVSRVSQNIGGCLIRGDSCNDQCRAAEPEVEEGNAELESKKCLTSHVKILGREMEGNERKGAGGVTANYQNSTDDSSLLSLLRTMDEQEYSSSPQKLVFPTKSQSGSDQQHIIEIEDEGNEDDDNVDVGPSPPVIRNGPFDLTPDQNLTSYSGCLQQILACVPNMENTVLDMEETFMDAQAELQHMREELKEKENKITSTKIKIKEELEARHTKVYRLEQDKKAMLCTFQECKMLFQNSSATFLEYRNNMVCGEGDESSSDVIGMPDDQNQICLMQQLHAHQAINKFQKYWLAEYSACVEKITVLATRMTDLNNEVQRLKDSRSIPDLNSGGPQL